MPADEDSTSAGMSSRRSTSAGTAIWFLASRRRSGLQAPALRFVRQVARGGGDDPHVRHRRVAAGARTLVILELLMKRELETGGSS